MLPNQQELFPLTFPVCVAGVNQNATVLEDASDDIAFKYKVRLDDGFEDIFTIVETTSFAVSASKPGNQRYEDALMIDLCTLRTIDPDEFYYLLPASLDGKKVNVWLLHEQLEPDALQLATVIYNNETRMLLKLKHPNEYWEVVQCGKPLNPAELKLADDIIEVMASTKMITEL